MYRQNTPYNKEIRNFLRCKRIKTIKYRSKRRFRELPFIKGRKLLYTGYREDIGKCWNSLFSIISQHHILLHNFFIQERLYFRDCLLDLDRIDVYPIEAIHYNILHIYNTVLGIERASYSTPNLSIGVSEDHILDTVDNEPHLFEIVLRFFGFRYPPIDEHS